ncbi:hypothetical protein IV38_GL000053 [Lactobacillus selangorensis]|uniref:Low temperature requirement protein A n=1 Tax=Lactobacillus selangorensis TaxID=81857 RepID=A0A0R2G270_9LACO|nr:hypothetical protein IV38_GL000053 [Lactobacillus selangorensis]KRN31468.1 hypothetical protein IV40_GL001465 [Lactobacillus selangorensis]
MAPFELFYDLIYAYAISRITATLHLVDNGIISGLHLAEFLMMMLVFWTIWTYQTVYANRFYHHGLVDTLFLLFNLFIVIYLAQAITPDFSATQTAFSLSTSTLFCSTAVQYLLQRHEQNQSAVKRLCSALAGVLGIAAVIGYATLFLPSTWPYRLRFGIYAVSILSAAFGPLLFSNRIKTVPPHFDLFTERYSEFILLLFGEAIITVSTSIQELHITPFNILYYLIIVLLFATYLCMQKLGIDHQRKTGALVWIHSHYFIAVAIALLPVLLLEFDQQQLAPFFTSFMVTLTLALFYFNLYWNMRAYRASGIDLSGKRLFYLFFSLMLWALFSWLSAQWPTVFLSGLMLYLLANLLYLWQFILHPGK